MALDPNEVAVAPTGQLLLAPEGTPAPTNLTTPWPAAWVDMGYLSEDAVTMGSSADETEIMAWQSDFPVWSNVRIGSTLAFQLMQWNGFNLQFAYGGGSYVEAGGIWTYKAPPASMFEVKALGLETVDGPTVRRAVFHRVKMSDRGDTVFRGDEASLFDLTVKLLDNAPAEPWVIISPLASAPPLATGATAGNPGNWTPAGSTPPANNVAANAASITASPATAWTTGQYVQGTTAGTAGEMYWNAAAWAAGKA